MGAVRSRWSRSHAAAVAIVLLTVGTASIAPADVGNPGPISLHIDGGAFSFADQDFEFGGDELPLPDIGLPATVDSDGVLTIAAAGFELPPFDLDFEGIPLSVAVSTTDLTGSIDPESGATTLDLTLLVEVTISDLSGLGIPIPIPSITCGIAPTLALASGKAGGAPYDATDGTASVAADALTLPPVVGPDPIMNAVCSVATGLITEQLGSAIPVFGLRLDIRTDPVLQAALPASVRGTVTDHGIGVKGLVVDAVPVAGGTGPSTTTRRSGAYSFADLPFGVYRLRVSDPSLGYTTTWVGGDTVEDARQLTLASGSSLVGNARVRGTGSITGVVVNRRDRPITDVDVALYRGSTRIARDHTGGRGGFGFAELGPGEYRLFVSDPTHAFRSAWYRHRRSGHREISLGAGQPRSVRVVLERR